jgi:hypothetical protein
MSDRQSVRSDLLEKYTGQEIVIRLLQLMNQYRSNIQIISRVSYVFADVAARESIIPSVAGQLSTPFNISLIPQLLVLEEIQAGRNVAPLSVQDIANLSVDLTCSTIFTRSDVIPTFITHVSVTHTIVLTSIYCVPLQISLFMIVGQHPLN